MGASTTFFIIARRVIIIKKWHIGDLPAEIRYNNGQKTEEHWYKDGRQYTPAKPSPAKDETAILAELAKE